MERNEEFQRDDVDVRTERAADSVKHAGSRAADSVTSDNVVHHDDHPSVGDQVGEAAGGISGVLAGAAIGSIGGPIGTVIGGLAGAIGGWWTGRAISEAASNFSHADDAHFRDSYEGSDARLGDRSYEDIRPAYQLGHLASHNPDYQGRDFEEIETDLQRGWTDDVSRSSGNWQQVRGFARDAYVRGREKGSEGERGTEVGSEAPSDVSTRGRSWHTESAPAGEGVENIGSSGLSARSNAGDAPAATNETARTEQRRDEGTSSSTY
jgi:hypothetical protein